MKFDFNDIQLKPCTITNIKSRGNIDIFYDEKYLPLMTAPMTSVIDMNNYHIYDDNNIISVLPRTVKDYEFYLKAEKPIPNKFFLSYSLNDFKLRYSEASKDDRNAKYTMHNILIDTANGHLKDIVDAVNIAKAKFPNLTIMIGNIANPETYKYYAENTDVDYIRCSIGTGNGCLTTVQSAIGYPLASLISECNQIRNELNNNKIKTPKIIADGGMKSYSDIIKALALGADFVMIGSLFAKTLESSGKNYYLGVQINDKLAKFLYSKGFNVKKKFYGMSTKLAQKELNPNASKLKTSEGVIRYLPVEYNLNGWIDNFKHYLRSAMSYTDKNTISDFIGKTDFIKITNNSYDRFKK